MSPLHMTMMLKATLDNTLAREDDATGKPVCPLAYADDVNGDPVCHPCI